MILQIKRVGKSVNKWLKNKKIICIAIIIVLSLIGYTAKIYSDIAFELTIDEKLYNIINPDPKSGVAGSSNSQVYIMRAYSTGDFQYIVAHGKRSLKYMLKKFASTDKDGLQEYVMARICCSILEESKLENSWITGREWYESYIKRSKRY
jgi:hypothetical protein